MSAVECGVKCQRGGEGGHWHCLETGQYTWVDYAVPDYDGPDLREQFRATQGVEPPPVSPSLRRPAAPVVQGADEESINLTPGVVWTHAQLDVIRDLLARNARLLAERDQAQAKVARVEALATELGSHRGGHDGDVAADIRRALDGSA